MGSERGATKQISGEVSGAKICKAASGKTIVSGRSQIVPEGIGPLACPYLAMASLLTGRRLGVRLVRIGLVGFVVTDRTAGSRAELAVSRHVAGGGADDGAFDAAFRLHARG
jgi:hypothetical protein